MTLNRTDEHLAGWISAPNNRGTAEIIWSCFFAVFVCTWTILHLNVPAATDRQWQRVVRKIRWMTLAVIVPEVVTCSSFVQRVAAQKSTREMKKLGCEWTLTQGFYLNMGGVWLRPRDSDAFPINATQLEHLIRKNVIACPRISKKDIWDRSKADKFAKLFACLQIFWLAYQCCARAIEGLAITPLEIATLGFAIPSVSTFAFWYHKPVDIEVPNIIECELTVAEIQARFNEFIRKWTDTPLDVVCRVNAPSVTSELIVGNKHWPCRDRFLGPANRIRNDIFGLKYSKLDQLVVFSVWVGYAGTHFSAWNFSFPTQLELIWWRVSCIVMSASMFVFWITSNRKFYLLIPLLFPWLKNKTKFENVAYEQKRVSGVQVFTGAFTTLAYLMSRLSLIALSFSSLRSLPRDAYTTVQWVVFWPHVS